jgi:hypothetical protein
MHSVVQWQTDEQITSNDLTLIGTLARETIDFITKDVISVGVKFSGFPVTSSSATALNIGAGRFFNGGIIYANADSGGVSLDLTNYLPLSTGNTKIISVIAFSSQADTDIEPRTYLLDATLGTTEARQTAVQNERHATLAINANAAEGPSPVPPPIAASQVEIARVTLSPTGVVSIAYVEANRIQSIDKLDVRAASLEAFEATAGKRIQTLGTDLANLANAITGLPNPAIFTQVVKTLADLQLTAKVPASAINFHEDKFLSNLYSSSDISNPAYVARVDEGLRFAWAQEQISYLSLLNPLDSKVQAGSGTSLMLPAYTEVARIDTSGNDGEKAVSQYQFQTIQAVQKSIARQVLQWGTSATVCDNSVWWSQGTYDPITGIFKRNGETFQAVFTGQSFGAGHEIFRVTQFWSSTETDTYTDYVTNSVSVSGAVIAQTFLNSQAGWLTSIDLFFTRVASSGDVTVLLCDVTNGAPDFKSVVARVTVPVASLKAYPAATNCPNKPTYLDPGSRYAIVVVTPGNHFVSTVANNKYAQGTLFYSTDGAFAQGDLTNDMAFRANFARFPVTVCQVQMIPLQLANGITDIKLLYGSKIPDGCDVVWEVQQNGIWYPLKGYTTAAGQASGTNHPLLGLPALLPLRLTYIGTTDLMPGIDMSVTETHTTRPRGDFTHTTLPLALGAPSSNIRVETVVDYFDAAHHSLGVKLTIAGADVSPTAVTTTADPNKAGRFTITSTFALGSPTSSIVIKIAGTTDTVTDVFHVESRFDYES